MFVARGNKVTSSPLRMFAFVFVATLGLCLCSNHNDTFLGTPELSGPSEALVRTVAVFKCELLPHPENETVLMTLFKAGRNGTWLGESTSLAGEAATFNLVVKPSYEGHLVCEARAQNNSNIKPTLSNTRYLKVIEPVRDARVIVVTDKMEVFEGSELELLCMVKAGNHVSYEWLLNHQPVSSSHAAFTNRSVLLINRTSPADSGTYVCTASNRFNGTVYTSKSSKVNITVKVVVSDPDISFTVLKEDSHNFSAAVTCQSAVGKPPVDFSLHNETQSVASVTSANRRAVFRLPVVFGEHLGKFRCQANNGAKTASSRWLPIKIEKVKGPASLSYDYDIAENFAVVGVRLYCKAAAGSHLQYEWFLNKSLLQDHGRFYYVFNQLPGQSILLLSVGRSSAGTYHCVVSNSFDNTTTISSRGRYLDSEVLNRLPVLVVAVVFGCFTFLILLLVICCGFGMFYSRREYGDKYLLEMQRRVVAYEGELDLSEYSDCTDALRTDGVDGFDQASEASVDEWPQIAKRKKTTEDDLIEVLV